LDNWESRTTTDDKGTPTTIVTIRGKDFTVDEKLLEQLAEEGLADLQQAGRKAQSAGQKKFRTAPREGSGGERVNLCNTEIGPVEVTYREYAPGRTVKYRPGEGINFTDINKKEYKKGMVFIQGWGTTVWDESYEQVNQDFSDHGDARVFAVKTRADKASQPDALLHEAAAVEQLIREQGLEEITVAGLSQGGAEAIDLVTLLQKNLPDLKINGLILEDAVRLYEQSPAHLISMFSADGTRTGAGMIAEGVKRPSGFLANAKTGIQAGTDVGRGVAKEMGRSGFRAWFKRSWSEVKEMASANPRTAEVRVPVAIIQGASDGISDYRKIDPNIFPNSPGVEVIKVPGGHGVALFNSSELVPRALEALDKYRNKDKGSTPEVAGAP